MKQISGDDVGFIVGRFQVDELTDGHRDLLSHAIKNHQKAGLATTSQEERLTNRRDHQHGHTSPIHCADARQTGRTV